jgi:hypothetical protein
MGMNRGPRRPGMRRLRGESGDGPRLRHTRATAPLRHFGVGRDVRLAVGLGVDSQALPAQRGGIQAHDLTRRARGHRGLYRLSFVACGGASE